MKPAWTIWSNKPEVSQRRPVRTRTSAIPSTTKCSDPELVLKHMDSGVLVNMIAKTKLLMPAIPTEEQQIEFYLRDLCYVYVLLGACTMSLGCQLPASYIGMLKKV